MSSKTKEDTKVELDPALTESAAQGSTAVQVPANAYEEDAGSGFENMDATFFKIPFIFILQKLSPQADEDNQEYMEGAKAGMLLHSVTKALLDGKEKGIAVVPLHVVKTYMEWIPRTQGGGLVGVYTPDDPKVRKLIKGHTEFDKITTDDGNELKMTFNVYCIVIRDDGTTEAVVLGMTSSNIGPLKDWLGLARGITKKNAQGVEYSLPLYSHVYRLKSKFNENKKGTWYGWNIAFEGGSEESALISPDSDLYRVAKEFRDMVVSGQATADTDSIQNEAPEEQGKEAF